jgi:hypothetical protein
LPPGGVPARQWLRDSMRLTHEQKEPIANLEVGDAVVSIARVTSPVLTRVRADEGAYGDRSDLSFEGEQ